MKVNSYGRLVYVEPNDFVNDTFPLDNVTWDPEDLNMSVDLQVIVPRRSDFGQTELTDGSRIITEVNWSDNSEIGKFISFMQGADIVGKYMDNMDEDEFDIFIDRSINNNWPQGANKYIEFYNKKFGGPNRLQI